MTAPKYGVITLFPEFVKSFFENGVIGQASRKGLFQYELVNPRKFTSDLHQTVDDRPFGGGDGMIMLTGPLQAAIEALKKESSPQSHVIYLSAQGSTLTQKKAQELSRKSSLIFVCGRYGGIDHRLLGSMIDEEISVGDYIVSGGEVPMMIVLDAVIRHLPGVLGSSQSVEKDSFFEDRLEAPQFTRPREYLGRKVPEVLFSGNHQKIEEWKILAGLLMTEQKRPDLLDRTPLNANECRLLKAGLSHWTAQDLELLQISEEILVRLRNRMERPQ